VFSNSNGFSLIEFLVALVIMMVGLLGLLQSVNLAINHNLQNDLRNTAVMLGDEVMAEQMKRGYDNLVVGIQQPYTTSRPVLSAMKNYSVSTTINQVSSGSNSSRQVTTRISWQHKNIRYDHGISGVISKME